jgi:hypothetical protein
MQRQPGSPTVHKVDAVGQRERAAELLNEADALIHGVSTPHDVAKAHVLSLIADGRIKLANQLNSELS